MNPEEIIAGALCRELGSAVTDYQVRRWARATIRSLERNGWSINRVEPAQPTG
ncbi:MAG TPA: hypothetical protein VIB48_12235 [Acidimicrobiia bacterium]